MQIKNLLTKAFALLTVMTFSTSLFAQAIVEDGGAPHVAEGSTVVFDDIIVNSDAAADLAAGDEVIVLLPEGSNFSGTPTATATNLVPGDPALLVLKLLGTGDLPNAVGTVTLEDTNGDGGMDKASVGVAVDADADDRVVIQGSFTSAESTEASAFDISAAVSVQDADDLFTLAGAEIVIAQAVPNFTDIAPLGAAFGANTLTTLPIDASSPTSTTVLLVTLPEGVEDGDTLTLTLPTGVEFLATSFIAFNTTLTTGGATIALDGTFAADTDLSDADFVVSGDVDRSTQIYLVLGGFDVDDTVDAGSVLISIESDGDEAVDGATLAFDVANSGIEVSLATDEETTGLVRGADAPQMLPTLAIDELFAADFGMDLDTITVSAPTGMTFAASGAISSDDSTLSILGFMAGDDEIVIQIDDANGGAAVDSVELSGVMATISDSAANSLAVSIEGSGDVATIINPSVVVATGNDRGTVTLQGPADLADPEDLENVGPSSTARTVDVVISESTYGSIRGDASNAPFVRIAGSADVEITGVAFTPLGGNTLAFAAAEEAIPADGTWVIELTAESDDGIDDDDGVMFTITYDLDDAVVGSTVSFTFSGDAGVAGMIDAATVVLGTVSSVDGAVPAVLPSEDAVDIAVLEIEETFDLALTNGGDLRVRAPAGVAFESAMVTGAAGVTIGTTFAANDRLDIATVTATAGEDTITVTATVFIAESVADGDITFTILDDNIAGDNEAGVTGESIVLAYLGDIDTLDAGASINLSLGVPQTRMVMGGLAPFTIASGDDAVFTVADTDGTFTVTGVAAGTSSLTVTDALGATDTVSVVVADAVAPPSLTTVASDGSTTTAVIGGGVSTDGGSSIDDDGVTVGDQLTIYATIAPQEAEVGESADIIVAVANSDGTGLQLLTAAGLAPADPIVAFSTITLAASNTINILGDFEVTEEFAGAELIIYVGYSLNGVIVYNEDPIELTIGAAAP